MRGIIGTLIGGTVFLLGFAKLTGHLGGASSESGFLVGILGFFLGALVMSVAMATW